MVKKKPSLFIGSSREQVDLAHAVQQNLEHNAEVTTWDQGVFDLSRSSLESLLTTLDNQDYAAFVFAPDDITRLRGQPVSTVRDNVIFELGLFIGRLGRDRCFIILPEEQPDLHLPTDLIGLTPATYDPQRSDVEFGRGSRHRF